MTESIKSKYIVAANCKALGQESPKGIPTEEITIDSMGLRVDFIKIDVEGSELEVLRGASETIARCSPVILAECLEKTEPSASLEAQERIAPFFRERGYRMFWLRSRLFRPENFRGSTEVVEGHDRNILAVKVPGPLTEGLEELL